MRKVDRERWDANPLGRFERICALPGCGKKFLLHHCGNYVYKIGEKYYCRYNHWRIAQNNKGEK